MTDIVIVKNNTGASVFIEDMGTAVPGSGQRTFSDIFDFTEICVSEDLKIFVNNSTFTINNGTSDLSIADAIEYLDCKNEGNGSIVFADLVEALAIKFISSDPVTATTSATYINKTSITFGLGVKPGKYTVIATADFQATNNNKQVGVRLYNITDAIVSSESIQQTNNITNWFSFVGQEVLTLDGLSNKTLAMQFVQIGDTTCNIRHAKLTLWRVE